MTMTALRARQVHGLYEYVDGLALIGGLSPSARFAKLKSAREALDAARAVVRAREKHYRVPVERIAAWKSNPTAYGFGYLWTVHSLQYWWRDEGKAVDTSLAAQTFCYMNFINGVAVAFGEEALASQATQFSCAGAPSAEPVHPDDMGDIRELPAGYTDFLENAH